MPASLLDQAAQAICGDGERRRAFSAALASSSAPHIRRVAASECVAGAAEKAAHLPEAWGFARNCMPYLLAESRADGIGARLRTLQSLQDGRELEDFFVHEARALGLVPPSLERDKYKPPTVEAVQRWVCRQLDRAAELRGKAIAAAAARRRQDDERNPIANYAVSTWIWLGRVFSITHLCFWQGRDRWLGGAAFPDVFNVATTVTTVGPPPTLWQRLREWLTGKSVDDEPDPEMARIIAMTQEQTRRQLAARSIQALRTLVESTSTLQPTLAVEGWAEFLPREGSGNLVSGAVNVDHLEALITALRQTAADGSLPYEGGQEWVELVVAAAVAAKDAGAHLVEGDDVLCGRWPILDE